MLNLDFAVVEGVFDKNQIRTIFTRRSIFWGSVQNRIPLPIRPSVSREIFRETLIVRESGSGTRRLLEQAISKRVSWIAFIGSFRSATFR